MPPLPHNPMGITVLTISCVGVFVDLIAIGLRLWSRKLKRKRLQLGEYLIIAAWLLAFADIFRKIIAFKWGVGLHIWDILATDPSHLVDAFAITFAGYFIWIASVTCIKLSILFVYKENFFCVTWFMRCVYSTMVLCILFCIGFMIGLCTQCTPFEMNYNAAVPGGRCGISRKGAFYLAGAINLTLDVILVLLPLPIVWRLKISPLKRLGVSAMFGLGVFIIVLVGVRFHLLKKQDLMDFTHDGEPPGIFTSLELYLGMISACLPFLTLPITTLSSSLSSSRLISYLNSVTGRSSRSRFSEDDGSVSRGISLEVIADKQHHSELEREHYKERSTVNDIESIGGVQPFVTVPCHWPSNTSSGQSKRDRRY